MSGGLPARGVARPFTVIVSVFCRGQGTAAQVRTGAEVRGVFPARVLLGEWSGHSSGRASEGRDRVSVTIVFPTSRTMPGKEETSTYLADDDLLAESLRNGVSGRVSEDVLLQKAFESTSESLWVRGDVPVCAIAAVVLLPVSVCPSGCACLRISVRCAERGQSSLWVCHM